MLKKVALWGLAAVGLLVVGFFVWGELTARLTAQKVQDRMAYWRSVVDRGVGVGERREEAEAWLRNKFPNRTMPAYDPGDPELVVSPESVDVIGSHFPCAAWIILITVHVGHDGRVISREVTDAGMCV